MRIPCALASSTPRENIDLALRRFSFASVFDTIVAAEDAPASKPDPSSFLTAARRLEAHPAECVIFEDAPAGIIAAHEAGMKVVAVATTRPLRALGGADIVVQRLDELSAAKLEDLFVYGVRHRL
jgi:beta-phosphoglucomutase-like phosphatase (HAD superfamily)